MMDLDEAIQHCKEQVQEQAKKGCYSCAEEHQQLAEWLKELKAYRNKSEISTSCGDAISRKAAIDLANELKDDLPDDDRLSDMVMSHNEGILDYQTKLSLLPSVSPQQRSGEWIERCDEIGKWYECDQCHTDWGGPVNYCPNCGCKMEVEE